MPYIGGDPNRSALPVTDGDLDAGLIADHTNIGAAPAETDELLISDGGVLKAITVDKLLDPAGYTNIGATPAGSDEVLLSDAGVLKAVTVTNLMAAASGGGITSASIWTLTTGFTGTQAPINANLVETSADGQGRIGDAMTQSSGIFTFPSTGHWWITFQIETNDNINSPYNEAMIVTTTNNSTYSTAAQSATYLTSGETRYTSCTLNILFDVTSTTNCKVRFDSVPEQSGVTTAGSSVYNNTYMTFIRLGDT